MYTYNNLLDDVNYLKHYAVDVGHIGASVLGNLIPYVHIGNYTGKQILFQGAIHARESITAHIIMRQIYEILNNYETLKGGIYFVPMTNPDGNIICERGVEGLDLNRAEFLKEVNGNNNFSLWKANANAVDLNTNFDAGWGSGQSNVTYPSSANFIGESPNSEPETQELIKFTNSVRPRLTVSYHALGREIYWYYHQITPNAIRDKKLVEKLNTKLNYNVVDNDLGSAGGYKDWCIKHLSIPAFTIEAVSNKYSHPIPDVALDDEWEIHKGIPKFLLESIL